MIRSIRNARLLAQRMVPPSGVPSLCPMHRLTTTSAWGVESSSQQRRSYAKHSSKNSTKSHTQSSNGFAKNGDSDLIDVDAFKADLQTELDRYRKEFVAQLSLRTNISAFENLTIKLPDSEGKSIPLNHMAKISLKNPQMLVINAAACPDKVRLITDALNSSALSVNPQAEGHMIFVPLPKVTREHRETMVKNSKVLYNKCLDRLRRVKKKYQNQWELNTGKVSPDILSQTSKSADELVKSFAKLAEDMLKHKQTELLSETNVN